VTFEYGLTTEYGNTVSAVQSPVTGNINNSVSIEISGLERVTTYHYRVVAENDLGKVVGSDMIFSTIDFSTFSSSAFSSMLFNLFGHQIEEDLCHDSWMGYLNTPTPFVGNVNNTTYYIRWNSYWGRIYGNVMLAAKRVIETADAEGGYPVEIAMAKLIRILGISKLTAYHGPVIYSNYGTSVTPVLYDSEADLYNGIFTELDQIYTVFNSNLAYTLNEPSYGGDVGKWIKVINSLRLRLAMRISKGDPALAKAQGEKAMSDPAGLITTNTLNFNVSLMGSKMPMAVICFEWDDTRMGAVMESFLLGLNDGRVAKYFQGPNLAKDPSLAAYPYLGVRNGAYIDIKDTRVPYSRVSEDFKSVQTRRSITAAEVSFLKAEAALRGWTGAGDAKTNYEDGVRLSFSDWGAAGVDDYLADATSKPRDYVDPYDARNNFTASSTITVAWSEADNNELKLEKIITQKWINNFTNTLESWADFRRTGYPKIPHVARNDSSADWGIISADEWIKRMPFITAERTGNAAGVDDATAKLGGSDLISTRLWWDVAGPNF
jgi:hypothetical protein